MQTYISVIFGSFISMAAAHGVASETPDAVGVFSLAQNTGAADRGLGNGSMGVGEEIKPLPVEKQGASAVRDAESQTDQRYDESGHGDNDTDMEHRPRRTLGDRNDD